MRIFAALSENNTDEVKDHGCAMRNPSGHKEHWQHFNVPTNLSREHCKHHKKSYKSLPYAIASREKCCRKELGDVCLLGSGGGPISKNTAVGGRNPSYLKGRPD